MPEQTHVAITYKIDWSLDEDKFSECVDNMIATAQKNNAVLPLPIALDKNTFTSTIAVILSQINCIGCDGQCCRQNAGTDDPIPIHRNEVVNIEKIIGKERLDTVLSEGEYFGMPVPCQFLDKAYRCTIYKHRPWICTLFPIQFGGSGGNDDHADVQLMALASECKEARRITKNIYVYKWRIQKSVELIGLR